MAMLRPAGGGRCCAAHYPGGVWHAIAGITGTNSLAGETGTIDFGGDVGVHVPGNKAIAILHLDPAGSDTPNQMAFCGHGPRPAERWCPPD
jgi:hypothetical protein